MQKVVTKFDDFLDNVYESVKNDMSVVQASEGKAIKSKITDSTRKHQNQNEKITIEAVKTKDPREKYRFEFKVVTKSTEESANRQTALLYLGNLMKDLLAKNKINKDFVAFLEIKNPNKRMIGDFVSSGVLSFYEKSILPNISLVKPIYSVSTSITESFVANPGKAILSENSPNAVYVYNYSDLQTAQGQTSQPINMQELITPDEKSIQEPHMQPIQPQTKVSSRVGQAAQSKVSQVDQAAQSSNTKTNPNQQEVPPEITATEIARKYVGLSKSDTPNSLIKDIQAKIIAGSKLDPDKFNGPAYTILSGGGANGKYNDRTAQAIGMLVNKDRQPIFQIGPRVSNTLVNILKGISDEQRDAVLTKSTPEITSVNKQSTDPNKVNTKDTQPAANTNIYRYEVETANPNLKKIYF